MVENKLNFTEHEPQGRIKIIGFDMDGTLIDTARQFPIIFGDFMEEEFGVSSQEAGMHFLQTQGIPTYEQILSFLGNMPSGTTPEMEELLQMGRIIDSRLAEYNADPFPEVEAALQVLKDEGYKMFVSSSHPTDVIEKKLITVKLDKFFPFWIGKDIRNPDLKKGEPHFRAASTFFNMQYEEFVNKVVYIGDAPSDIESTLQARVTAIGRTGSRSRDELYKVGMSRGVVINIVDNFLHLPEFVKEI